MLFTSGAVVAAAQPIMAHHHAGLAHGGAMPMMMMQQQAQPAKKIPEWLRETLLKKQMEEAAAGETGISQPSIWTSRSLIFICEQQMSPSCFADAAAKAASHTAEEDAADEIGGRRGQARKPFTEAPSALGGINRWGGAAPASAADVDEEDDEAKHKEEEAKKQVGGQKGSQLKR